MFTSGSFIDFRTPDHDHLPPTFLRAELLTFLLAGADTIASGLCASLFLILSSSPSVEPAILAELADARAAHHLSPAPQFLEILHHCPFFVACVRESMRLSPAVPNILPRLVSAESPLVLSDGKEVPGGTEVASNPWISHRDAASFGEDAEIWRPQRWLEDGAEVLERLNFTFGFGSRVCLGKEIALMEILKGVLAVGVNVYCMFRRVADGAPSFLTLLR
jgi:cytochrome P450